MVDAVGLHAVGVPEKLPVFIGCYWAHHLVLSVLQIEMVVGGRTP